MTRRRGRGVADQPKHCQELAIELRSMGGFITAQELCASMARLGLAFIHGVERPIDLHVHAKERSR